LREIVELSLLAWEPVFESFDKVLGLRFFSILYTDWRKTQTEGVGGRVQGYGQVPHPGGRD